MVDLTTLPDGQYTAVVDAIEDELATVFFEQDDQDVGEGLLDVTKLPDEARHADALLTARIEEGELVELAYDPDLTAKRSEKAQSRFDRLSERPPSTDES